MAFPGEVNRDGTTCPDCKDDLELQVCFSAAGYYIGTMCRCGPNSRESGYYKTREEAEYELEHGFQRRSTEYWGQLP